MRLKTIFPKIISSLKDSLSGVDVLNWLDNMDLCTSEVENLLTVNGSEAPFDFSEQEIKAILKQDPDVIAKLIIRLFTVISEQHTEIESLKDQIEALKDQNEALKDHNEQLKNDNKELKDRLNTNSKNSNKPPSSDVFDKPKSNRKKSGKPKGGQKGHQGYTLNQVENPDKVIHHQVKECKDCGHSLESIDVDEIKKHQVFDLPPVEIEVTEHQLEHKLCPHCGCENKAACPEGAEQPTQYGPELKSLAVYLRHYQLLPYHRIKEFFEDLFNHSISTGTLVNFNRVCYNTLKPVEEEIKSQITNSAVVHFDETGIRVEANNTWLHVASTSSLTYYFAHPNRGQKATEDIDILPHFEGTAVHDNWPTYFKYICDHALCNAHHLRELTSCEERDEQQWATDMKELLLEIKEAVESGDHLSPDKIKQYENRYSKLVEQGLELNTPLEIEQKPGKRGRKKQTKTKNLLDRLDERDQYVLAFMHDSNVPFDNNQAERDLRMTKVQQKISGTFRSWEGAKYFARIRGYVSTARKNGYSLLEALKTVFGDDPIIPNQQPP